jgi:hypothetical protein
MRPEMKDYSLDAPQYTNPNLTQPAKYTPLMKCRGGKPRKNLNKYYSSGLKQVSPYQERLHKLPVPDKMT